MVSMAMIVCHYFLVRQMISQRRTLAVSWLSGLVEGTIRIANLPFFFCLSFIVCATLQTIRQIKAHH